MSETASVSRVLVPALRRDGRMLGGVAAGLVAALAVDPLILRLAFVALTAAGGIGVVLYAGLWIVMAGRSAEATTPVADQSEGHLDRVIGIALATVGIALLVDALGLGFDGSVAWPVGLVALGLLVSWHRGRLGGLVDGDRSRLARVGGGLLIAGAGIIGLIALNLDLAEARDTLLLSGAVVVGLGLAAAPTVTALARDLAEERRQRVRSEERARMAAHLHDSVLQTLALVQRHADDPTRTRALARSQERELRSWLYDTGASAGADSVRVALEAACADVERLHGVPVETVVVRDLPADDRVREVVAAAREAIVNAARHSGAPRIDVFAEIEADALSIFVRDVGVGFDLDGVPGDRRGIRDSIVGRLEHAGGTAAIASSAAGGTEVELRLPLGAR